MRFQFLIALLCFAFVALPRGIPDDPIAEPTFEIGSLSDVEHQIFVCDFSQSEITSASCSNENYKPIRPYVCTYQSEVEKKIECRALSKQVKDKSTSGNFMQSISFCRYVDTELVIPLTD